MINLTTRIDRAWYPGFRDNWDDWLFREHILAQVHSNTIMLDLGAGAGTLQQMHFRGIAKRVCGVDLDPRVADNPMLDEAKIADAGRIPYDSQEFDLVYANNVLEHLREPLTVFREVARVLKPGGTFMFKTPNKWHYVPVIASLTPHGFHQYVNALRGRPKADTFPTIYRANSRRDIAHLAAEAGMSVKQIEHIEGRPEYLRFAWPAYLCGAAYERLVNTSDVLSGWRVLIIGTLKK